MEAGFVHVAEHDRPISQLTLSLSNECDANKNLSTVAGTSNVHARTRHRTGMSNFMRLESETRNTEHNVDRKRLDYSRMLENSVAVDRGRVRASLERFVLFSTVVIIQNQ